MNILENLKYTRNHEWVKFEGDYALIGITDPAQEALGDIVFVELPEVDSHLDAGDVLGVVESVKSASDFYTPVRGRVAEINSDLTENPEMLNEDAYANWIAKLDDIDPESDELMDAEAYRKFCEEENL